MRLLAASSSSVDVIYEARRYAQRAGDAASKAEKYMRNALNTHLSDHAVRTWADASESAARRCGQYADLAGLYAPESAAHREALGAYTMARLHAKAARGAVR